MVSHLRTGTVPAFRHELVVFNGIELKGALTENTWEISDENSTMPYSLRLPPSDESNNKVLQTPFIANDEQSVPT
eukprot:6639972-Ditylum_brightwellii.AAC.1